MASQAGRGINLRRRNLGKYDRRASPRCVVLTEIRPSARCNRELMTAISLSASRRNWICSFKAWMSVNPSEGAMNWPMAA